MDLHIYVPQMVEFINAPRGAIEINNLIHFRDCAVIASHYGNSRSQSLSVLGWNRRVISARVIPLSSHFKCSQSLLNGEWPKVSGMKMKAASTELGEDGFNLWDFQSLKSVL